MQHPALPSTRLPSTLPYPTLRSSYPYLTLSLPLFPNLTLTWPPALSKISTIGISSPTYPRYNTLSYHTLYSPTIHSPTIPIHQLPFPFLLYYLSSSTLPYHRFHYPAKIYFHGAHWFSGRVLHRGAVGSSLMASLRCILETDTLILA